MVVTLAISMLAIFGCNQSEFGVKGTNPNNNGTQPDIDVVPLSLTYAEHSLGEVEDQFFTVLNHGGSSLTVIDIALVSGTAFTFTNTGDDAFEVEPDALHYVDLSFTPLTTNDIDQAIIYSDDPDQPEITVDLEGFGRVPELRITPDDFDFGQLETPCDSEVDLVLENVGTDPLDISDWSFASTNGLLSFDPASAPTLPQTMQPGGSTTLTVDFDAAITGSDNGTMTVVSNDPRGDRIAEVTGAVIDLGPNTDIFTEPGIPSVDIIFLIDNSCSMSADNQDDITLGVPPFLAELQNVANWQMIEVTKDHGCSQVGIIDNSTQGADTLLINGAFSPNYGQHTEALLQLADIALQATAPGECNYGFLRPGALLHILVASDEREQSGINWQTWLDSYAIYTGSPDLVTVSSVVDINTACGDGSGPDGYLEAANATGGELLDICSPTWGTQMTNIAQQVQNAPPTYELTEEALDGTVEVYINGVQTQDFTFSDFLNTITVLDPIYQDGDTVQVDYTVGGICP